MAVPKPEPLDFAAGFAAGFLAGARFVAAVDERAGALEAGFLVVERAAPDAVFARVVVLVFRAEEEVPRDAIPAPEPTAPRFPVRPGRRLRG